MYIHNPLPFEAPPLPFRSPAALRDAVLSATPRTRASSQWRRPATG